MSYLTTPVITPWPLDKDEKFIYLFVIVFMTPVSQLKHWTRFLIVVSIHEANHNGATVPKQNRGLEKPTTRGLQQTHYGYSHYPLSDAYRSFVDGILLELELALEEELLLLQEDVIACLNRVAVLASLQSTRGTLHSDATLEPQLSCYFEPVRFGQLGLVSHIL